MSTATALLAREELLQAIEPRCDLLVAMRTPLKLAHRAFAWRLAMLAIEKCQQNVEQAARLLGINRATAYNLRLPPVVSDFDPSLVWLVGLEEAQRQAIEQIAREFSGGDYRYKDAVRMFERSLIHAALRLEHGNHKGTAHRLSVHGNTIYNKLRRQRERAA